MSYRIGSFNVNNLSQATGRDLDRIASIINDNNLDIVAMQEVLSAGKILTGIGLKDPIGEAKAYEYSLKRRLRGNWRICWRDPLVRARDYAYLGSDKRGEGYAFLWNADRVDLLRNAYNQEIHPQIWNQYKTNKEGLPRLLRNPLVGRFKVKDRLVEIRLITTHIIYGKPSRLDEDMDLNIGAITMRRQEFETLAGSIYSRVNDFVKDKSTDRYTIMLGDYNLNLKASGINTAILPDVVCFDKYGHITESLTEKEYIIFNTQHEKTTINQEGSDYASNYDHFSYDDNVRPIIKNIDRISVFGNNNDSIDPEEFYRYKKEVSDHIPIMIEIDC